MKRYRKYFVMAIKDTYPEKYRELILQVDASYKDISLDTRFALTSRNPIDKRLDFCAYFLALIKTLDQEGETFENIREICLRIVTEYVRPKNKLQQLSRQVLPKLTNTWLGRVMIRLFHARVSTNTNPEGFIANIITDKNETYGLGYGIDILACGICKLFKRHNYEKYASILCEVDEITSDIAGLELIRTGTIANGAVKCDFRFRRKE